MKENIARRANLEDRCTGRFWEGRFKSIALLNEAAVLACMQYIDLNPIRAGVAETPESSDFTSAQDRIASGQARKKLLAYRSEKKRIAITNQTRYHEEIILRAQNDAKRGSWLSPIKRITSSDKNLPLNLSLDEYLGLLDWTGRHLKEGKKGLIPKNLETILVRVDIETEEWLNTVGHFGSLFFRVAGSVKSLVGAALVAARWYFKVVLHREWRVPTRSTPTEFFRTGRPHPGMSHACHT